MGGIVFITPWILSALFILPVLWWLLRLTPPLPRSVQFPPVRLLHDLINRQETSAHTPWWLLLLRLVLVALIIVGLARPVLNPVEELPYSGKNILLVIDNSWAAARNWPVRQQTVLRILDQAERGGKTLQIILTAPPEDAGPIRILGPLRPAEARGIIEALSPSPWPADHQKVQTLLEENAKDLEGGYSIWFSDGVSDPQGAAVTEKLVTALQHMGGLMVLRDRLSDSPHLLRPPTMGGSGFTLKVERAQPAPSPYTQTVLLQAEDGRFLGREKASFQEDATEATVTFNLLPQVRNEIARISLKEEQTAGATVLLDSRWQRHTVGLVSRHGEEQEQTLLGELYYLTRALAPFAEVYEGTILNILERNPSVLILPDIGAFSKSEREGLEEWVADGGVLVRFAGPRMAEHAQILTPVPVRNGVRNLTGTLAWSSATSLAPFPEGSPFYGLALPQDLEIHKQILAEPTPDLPAKTWARLTDGTPLITGAEQGNGWLILIHTTANPDWANLSLSGLFVQLLQRVLYMGSGAAQLDPDLTLRAQQVLNAYGYLSTPSVSTTPVKAAGLAKTVPGPDHPPGFYGTERVRRALNLGGALPKLEKFVDLPMSVDQSIYGEEGETDLMPWCLLAAILLFAADMLIVLWIRGVLWPALSVRRAAAICFLILLAAAAPPDAWADDSYAISMTAQTHLAYVSTGSPAIDDITRAGLEGLRQVLERRTSLEIGDVVEVNVNRDEMAFFPFIYWPVSLDQKPLTEQGIHNLRQYLANGGMVLFDTRDQQFLSQARERKFGVGTSHLRTLLAGLDLPPLVPVPDDHVLTRSFYLLSAFPGQYTGGQVWIDVPEDQTNDGVPSVIIGGHDWVGAWAVDSYGQPLNTVSPGGERQREMAYRFGVNVVMMALTGNYKADQVHVPYILERLGQ